MDLLETQQKGKALVMNDLGIGKFLEPLGLTQYAGIFKIKGFDVETDFNNIDEANLIEMGIENEEHRELILHAGTW